MTERKITQNNLYLILPGKVSRIAMMYAHDFGVTIKEALEKVYSSRIYRELENEETKLWHLGPVALYQKLLENESGSRQCQGRTPQPEG